MIKIEYDPAVDALYIRLREVGVHDSIDVEEGVTIDRDAHGHIVGIEVLDAKLRIGADPLTAVSIERLLPEEETPQTEVA